MEQEEEEGNALCDWWLCHYDLVSSLFEPHCTVARLCWAFTRHRHWRRLVVRVVLVSFSQTVSFPQTALARFFLFFFAMTPKAQRQLYRRVLVTESRFGALFPFANSVRAGLVVGFAVTLFYFVIHQLMRFITALTGPQLGFCRSILFYSMVSGPSWSYSKEFHKDGVVFVFLLEGTQFDWRWTIFTDESLPLDEIFMIFYRFFLFPSSSIILIMTLTCFRSFIGFYWVSLGFTGFYSVLLDFTGFYWVSLGFTGFYLVLLGFTEFHEVLPVFIRFNRVLLGFSGFYWVLLGFTEI